MYGMLLIESVVVTLCATLDIYVDIVDVTHNMQCAPVMASLSYI